MLDATVLPARAYDGTSPTGVVVAWAGRKGTETALSWQQSRNMLVRAGRLAPCVPSKPQPSGAELVGLRVRVYWPGDDQCFAGYVAEFAHASGMHRIVYDDGEEWWERLGSELAPEYVVL